MCSKGFKSKITIVGKMFDTLQIIDKRSRKIFVMDKEKLSVSSNLVAPFMLMCVFMYMSMFTFMYMNMLMILVQ